MALRTGTRLGPYEILAAIGSGGMGEVYRARDPKLGREVAIKVLPGDTASDPEARARFEREARAVASLSHPHIVTIHDIFDVDGTEFIVMELVPGLSLDRIIPEQGLPVEQAIDLGHQVASALEAAHAAGVVHRDIKPANIMVSDTGQVKVLDFGLAKLFDLGDENADTITAPLATAAGAVMGTVAYMSPEQAKGQSVDARSDIFSFGAVLYEMLAGRRPFPGPTSVETLAAILASPPSPLQTVRAGLPSGLTRLVEESLDKDRAARPAAPDIVRRLNELRTTGRPVGLWTGNLLLIGAAIVIAAAVGGWLFTRTSGTSPSTATAIAEVGGLVQQRNLFEAFTRARDIQRAAAGSAEFARLWQEIVRSASITTEPPGAEVAIAPYGTADDSDRWIALGKTPLNDIAVPGATFRARVRLAGYAVAEDVIVPHVPWNSRLTLIPERMAPPGMARAEGLPRPLPMYLVPGADPVDITLPDFWIDRTEVTNRQFKAFLVAGGYTRREFWIHPFERNGRSVLWDDAMRVFRDATGRPGPATWQAGAYPDGQDDFPVTGVSWYEADAYLRFAGKHLPTLPHWWLVGGYRSIADLLPRANFGGRGPVPVGSTPAVHRFGAQDLAGNVKEWLANSAGGGLRYIVGGAWDEPPYMFAEPDARQPFERAPNFGIRGARFDDNDRTPETLGGVILRPDREYTNETPAPSAVFDAYRRFFAYDRAPVKATEQAVQDSHREWRVETLSFPAAYPGETVVVHMFLPKQGTPPFQTVVYMPGASQFTMRSSQSEIEAPFFAHVLRSGRAVALPIVKGAFERGSEDFNATTSKTGTIWRDYVVAFYKDVARTIDYLETRADVARDRIGFFGLSRGAALAPIVLSLEPQRIKTAVLVIPGLYLSKQAPEVDVFNFLSRVEQPALMLSGRYDFIFPEQRSQVPFFQMLSTPADRKRRVVYDSGHNIPSTEMIKETLDWLDRTLGPVK